MFNVSRKSVIAGAVLATLTMGAAAPAMAAPVHTELKGFTSPVDARRASDSTLSIEKHALPDGVTSPGTGAVDGAAQGETLAGAKFSIQLVESINGEDISKLDMTKNESWAKLGSLVDDKGQPKGEVTLGKAQESPETGDNGRVKFSNLKFGLYKVTETQTPKGAAAADPFFVTLPQWITANKSYNYDPILYPKNSVNTATKEVDNSKLTGTDTAIDYTVKTDVRKKNANATTIGKYEIYDQLDKRLTTTPERVTVAFDEGQDAELTAGGDYNVTIEDKNVVKVTFTEKGIAKLDKYASSKTKLVTKINATFDAKGDIKDLTNKAEFVPNDDPKWDTEKVPTNEVTTELGKIEVLKVDAANEETKLANAKFKVKTADGAEVKFYANGNTNAAVTEASTLEGGKLTISGLKADGTKYYLVETEAPAGYSLLAEPIEITLDTQEGTDGSTVAVTVKDPKKNVWFELPHTGASDVILLVAGGTLAIGAGASLMLVKRRRENEVA